MWLNRTYLIHSIPNALIFCCIFDTYVQCIFMFKCKMINVDCWSIQWDFFLSFIGRLFFILMDDTFDNKKNWWYVRRSNSGTKITERVCINKWLIFVRSFVCILLLSSMNWTFFFLCKWPVVKLIACFIADFLK